MRVLLVVLILCLIPTPVLADELWVKNEGGVEITVWSDNNWQDVTVTGEQGLMGVGPGWEPADGVAKVCAVTVPNTEWLVIHADNITDYRIDVACDQSYEYITPEVRLVKDAPPNPVTFDGVSDSGKSIQSMNVEKDIAEYNSWFATQSWNELD